MEKAGENDLNDIHKEVGGGSTLTCTFRVSCRKCWFEHVEFRGSMNFEANPQKINIVLNSNEDS